MSDAYSWRSRYVIDSDGDMIGKAGFPLPSGLVRMVGARLERATSCL
jgi:hypothetical protein